MQVTETVNEGLRREFRVVVPATELDGRLVERLSSLKDEVRIKGFRPGKVPVSHLRRMFGRSTMAEIVQSVLTEVARETLTKRGEKAAAPPDYRLPEDQEATERILSGEADLDYTMAYEVLPRIDLTDFKKISVERQVVEVSDEEVDEQLRQLAENARSFATKAGAAETGDRVTVSYVGTIDGEPFQGSSEDNVSMTIGEGQFMPGFAEQLVGLATGDSRTVKVSFPEDYSAKNLAGKEAAFEVTVKAVASADAVAVDDQLAERLGLQSLETLRDTLRQQIGQQYTFAARQRLKRALLDRLDETHPIELPPGMVEQEFESIWRQVTSGLSGSGKSFESEGTTEEAARIDYRQIAERRVRLGLVMSEIGERNDIRVTEEEVQRALAAQMRQLPGQEQALVEYYRNNPEGLAALRAPIFEEKVVDFLLELVKVTDRTVSREELLNDDDEPTV